MSAYPQAPPGSLAGRVDKEDWVCVVRYAKECGVMPLFMRCLVAESGLRPKGGVGGSRGILYLEDELEALLPQVPAEGFVSRDRAASLLSLRRGLGLPEADRIAEEALASPFRTVDGVPFYLEEDIDLARARISALVRTGMEEISRQRALTARRNQREHAPARPRPGTAAAKAARKPGQKAARAPSPGVGAGIGAALAEARAAGLVTTKEALSLIGVTQSIFTKWVRAGRIRVARRVGAYFLFEGALIEEVVRAENIDREAYLSTAELADFLGVSRNRVHYLREGGRLEWRISRGNCYFPRSQLEGLVRKEGGACAG